jgi:hypothetical protein
MRRGHYTTPEPSKKARMVLLVNDPDIPTLLATQDDVGTPLLHANDGAWGGYWADADELRAWREARSQHTSGAADGT